MRLKSWTILALAGLVLIGVGADLTQIAYRGETRQVIMHDIMLEIPGNGSSSIPLGLVDSGSHVEITLGSTLPIELRTVQTETGRPIEGMIGASRGTTMLGSHPPMPGIFYDITEPLDLSVIVNMPAEKDQPEWARPYTKVDITFLSINIFPPMTYPYTTVGMGLVGAGILVLVAGIAVSRRTRQAEAIRPGIS